MQQEQSCFQNEIAPYYLQKSPDLGLDLDRGHTWLNITESFTEFILTLFAYLREIKLY